MHRTDYLTLRLHAAVNKAIYVEFLALPPLLFALQAEQLFLVSANCDITSHSPPQC